MRTTRIGVAACALTIVLFAACGGKGESSAGKAASSASTSAARTAIEPSRQVTKASESDNMAKQIMGGIDAMTNPNAKKKWQFEIDGLDLPTLSGGSVMVVNMPGLMTHYTFVGGEQMTTLDLEGVESGTAGTFKPVHLQILYTSKKVGCGASSMDPNSDVTVKLEPTGKGVRGTIEGTVVCREINQSTEASKPQTGTLHAWFEK